MGFKLRGPDLNRRPRGYEPRELPGCSTPRHLRRVVSAVEEPNVELYRGEEGSRGVEAGECEGHFAQRKVRQLLQSQGVALEPAPIGLIGIVRTVWALHPTSCLALLPQTDRLAVGVKERALSVIDARGVSEAGEGIRRGTA